MSTKVKRIIAAGIAGSAALGAAVLLTTGASASTTPGEAAMLRAIAARAAHASGDDSPYGLRWVKTNRGDGERVTAGALLGQDTAREVYVLQMRGHFTALNASVPRGAAVPIGTVMTLTVDAITGEVTDSGLTGEEQDLSALGDVHNDG